jgi:hypothetical protein
MITELQTTIIPPTYTDGPLEGSLILTAEDKGIRHITPEEIKHNFRRAMLRFNEKSCDAYIEKYARRRGKCVPEVRARRNDIQQAKKNIEMQKRRILENIETLQKRELKYQRFKGKLYELRLYLEASARDYIARKIKRDTPEYEVKMSAACRVIGNTIHDLVRNNSGLVSLDAYDTIVNNKDTKLVWEHYYPRSRAGGEDIFLHCVAMIKSRGEYTLRDLFAAACTGSEVARTTKKENIEDLDRFQTKEMFTTPSESYERADVPVVRYEQPEYHSHWIRLAEELNKILPVFHEFPQEITTEQADQLLTQKE